METYIIYIGKVALAAGAFYIVFLLLFQNQKQFVFNRFYLPVSLAVSFIIPLITFTMVKYIEPVSTSGLKGFAYLPESTNTIEAPQFIFEWYHYLFVIYILGSFGFLFHLLLGHFKAISIVKRSWIKNLFQVKVNVTQKDIHPFSFFNKIVLSENTLSSPNLEIIVNHENIHVKEKHTLDILFSEILFLLQWFNPFAWLLKDAIKNNLEYLTDHQIAQNHNPQEYQLAMVALADKKGVAPFLNALNGSQLKNRIIMMKKKTENKYAFVKQLLILPLLAVLVMGLSNKEVKTEIIQPEIKINQDVIKGKVTDKNGEPISGATIIVKGKTVGTITDQNGNYEIELNNDNETLVFLMVGFEKILIPVEEKTTIDVQLKSENTVKVNSTLTKTFIKEKEYKYEVSGKITNEKGEPIPAVNIVLKGKPIGTITNTNGDYKLGINNKNETLIFSMVGYEIKEISANGKKKIDVQLAADSENKKDEIRVVGYPLEEDAENGKIKIRASDSISENPPLYIVNGKEVEDITYLDPNDIEKISVIKDESATELYGEKGKNGVILITTKKTVKFNPKNLPGNPLIIVDGKEFAGDINDIDVNDISSIEVKKNQPDNNIYDGKEPEKDKIIIHTKTKYNIDQEKPLIVIDGIISTYKSMDDIDPSEIKSVDVLKDKSATEIYGEKGKNGVILITMKADKIDTELKLRKFIAQNIKYPVIAQRANTEKTVYLSIKVSNSGVIKEISEKASNLEMYKKVDFMVDEVVVTGYKNKEVVVTGYASKEDAENAKEAQENLLIDETKRVINKMVTIDIDEFKGKTIGLTVKFVLQD